MSLGTAPIQDDIIARLRANLPLDVYDAEVPDTKSLPTSNTLVKPYIVVYFSEPVRAAVGRGIVSSRLDTNRAGLTVQVVAPRSVDARKYADSVKNILAGYKPPDAGELILEGGAAADNGTANASPTAFSRYVAFSFFCNLIVGDLIE